MEGPTGMADTDASDIEGTGPGTIAEGDLMAITVTITEMYDMRTVKDKLGVIGIHTPTTASIARRWHGLFDNHRKFQIVSCSIKLASASMLPADPLQIGITGNAVAPEDIMNPILYRAVTNESWNSIINRIYSTTGTDVNSVHYMTDDAFSSVSAEQQRKVYYGLLGSNEWKKAMPQTGLSMGSLRPLVYSVVSTFGNVLPATAGTSSNQLDRVVSTGSDGAPFTPGSAGSNAQTVFKGRAHPYPSLPCSLPGSTTIDGYPYPFLDTYSAAKSYVACIVMPPATLTVMYYRLLISWKIRFFAPVSAFEKESLLDVSDAGSFTYTKNYSITSARDISEVAEETKSSGNTVDTVGSVMELVMEK